MPDTGEDREIKQGIDAKEAQIETASRKLLQKSKTATDRIGRRRRRAATEETAPSGAR
jgi:hypothetical protein